MNEHLRHNHPTQGPFATANVKDCPGCMAPEPPRCEGCGAVKN